MDYSPHTCDQCGIRYHPANDVKLQRGHVEFHFDSFECRDEWVADHSYPDFNQLELQLGLVGSWNE